MMLGEVDVRLGHAAQRLLNGGHAAGAAHAGDGQTLGLGEISHDFRLFAGKTYMIIPKDRPPPAEF